MSTAVLPMDMVAAVGINLLIDGRLLGLSATRRARRGLIITLALTVDILFLSMSLAIPGIDSGLGGCALALVVRPHHGSK